MAVTHLKHGKPEAEWAEDDARVRMSVEGFLADIAARGDVAGQTIFELARRFRILA